jgi:hypothetical protein
LKGRKKKILIFPLDYLVPLSRSMLKLDINSENIKQGETKIHFTFGRHIPKTLALLFQLKA